MWSLEFDSVSCQYTDRFRQFTNKEGYITHFCEFSLYLHKENNDTSQSFIV